jgi:hypothetical protein
MPITVKHSKVSTIPDDADTSLVRPSDWNADHTLAGVGTAASLDAGVANGVATLDSAGKVPTSQIPTLSYVPYTGATGAVDLNAKSLVNVSNFGVNTTTVPTIKIRAVGDNNSTSRIAMRGYSSDANSSAIRVTKFRGTAGAPQAPQSGDSLGKFELAGYGTTSSEGYPQASLEGVATESWGATARGTKAVIKVTPNTTTAQVTALTINQDSSATFSGAISTIGLTNSALTSGRVTYAGTGGVLQDSANLYFDGTNLGIGTTSPSAYGGYASLTTAGSTGSVINMRGGATQYFEIAARASDTYVKNIQAADLWFGTSNAERLRIFASGGVSIGNTTDAGAGNLSVTGSALAARLDTSNSVGGGVMATLASTWSNTLVTIKGDGATGAGVLNVSNVASSAALPFIIQGNGTERMRVHSSGGVSIGNTVDSGAASLNVSGLIFPQQAASAPTYQKGAIYFDTTLNKLRVGGATGWETITSI